MPDLNDADLFLVERPSTGGSYKLRKDNLVADLLDADLMLVERSGKSFKATGVDIKDSFGGSTPAIVTAPTLIATPNTWPSSLTATTPTVINATQDTSYAPWFEDGVQIVGSSGLNYTADSSGVWKYQERWVGNDGSEVFPNAEVTIAQPKVAKPSVIAPADGAGTGGTVTYQPETSAITNVVNLTGGWNNYSGTTEINGLAYGNGRFVALGSAASLRGAWSTDGVSWNFVDAGGTDSTWRSLAFGENTFVGVAVGSSNNAQRIGYSTDNGENWIMVTDAQAPNNNKTNFNSIAYGNGKFVAVASAVSVSGYPKIIQSSDGITWGDITINAAYNKINSNSASWYGVTHVELDDGTKRFIAVAYSSPTGAKGVEDIAYSSDGLEWYLTDSGLTDNGLSCVGVCNKRVLALATGGTTAFYSDNAGLTWQATTVPSGYYSSISSSGNQFLMGNSYADSRIHYSPDALTFTESPGSQAALNGANPGEIVYGGDKWVVGVANANNGSSFTWAFTPTENSAALTLTNDKAYNADGGADMGQTISEVFNDGDTVKADSAAAGTSDAFSSTIYTSIATDKDVTTGIDNTTKAMIWIKGTKQSSTNNYLVDTERGPSYIGAPDIASLSSNSDRAEVSSGGGVSPLSAGAFPINTTGFHLTGGSAMNNASGYEYNAWNFRAAPNFMDVVTFEGENTNAGDVQAVPHSLASVPGMMIIKRLNDTEDWGVWHQDIPNSKGNVIKLNSSDPASTAGNAPSWGQTNPTASEFYVGRDAMTGLTGNQYVAYLFAATGYVKCGTYDGSNQSVDISLGFKAQFFMTRNLSNGSWAMYDTNFNSPSTMGNYVKAEDDAKLRSQGDQITVNSTGLIITGTGLSQLNNVGDKYIYIAIAENNAAGNLPPTGTLTADADDSGPTMKLTDTSGVWENGMKVINNKSATKSAPDPATLEFVGSVPAAATGTISTWGNATWSVTTGGVTQTQDVSITSGVQQKLKVADAADITLAGSTTYDVTVKYAAPDCVANTSDPNQFSTAIPQGWSTVSIPVDPNSGAGSPGWNAINVSPDTGTLIAVSTYWKLARSTDNGVTWVQVGLELDSRNWNEAAYGNGKWIVCGTNGDQTSSGGKGKGYCIAISTDDGLTWTQTYLGDGTPQYDVNCTTIAFGNNKWVIVTSNSSNDMGGGAASNCPVLYSDATGTVWTVTSSGIWGPADDSSTNYNTYRVRYISSQGVFIAIRSTYAFQFSSSSTQPFMYSTTGGTSWIPINVTRNGTGTGEYPNAFFDATYFAGKYYFLNSSGTGPSGNGTNYIYESSSLSSTPIMSNISVATNTNGTAFSGRALVADDTRMYMIGSMYSVGATNNTNILYTENATDWTAGFLGNPATNENSWYGLAVYNGKWAACNYNAFLAGFSLDGTLTSNPVTYYYDSNNQTSITGDVIVIKHGIEPDSNAARDLGFAELTEQPSYAVSGYQLQADGKYKPIRNLLPEIAQAASAWAQSTSYTIGQIVLYNGNLYQVTVAHTSSSSFNVSDFELIGAEY